MRLIAASVSLGSPLAVALLGVLVLAELGLLGWALIDLARRPADRVAGGSRLLWLLLCLFVQLIGPVIYLVVGRLRAAPAGVPPPRSTTPPYPARMQWTAPRRLIKRGTAGPPSNLLTSTRSSAPRRLSTASR